MRWSWGPYHREDLLHGVLTTAKTLTMGPAWETAFLRRLISYPPLATLAWTKPRGLSTAMLSLDRTTWLFDYLMAVLRGAITFHCYENH